MAFWIYNEGNTMKKSTLSVLISLSLSGALLAPSTAFAGCKNAMDLFKGRCNKKIEKTFNDVVRTGTQAFDKAGSFANDITAQAYGYTSSKVANEFAKAEGFTNSATAQAAGFGNRAALETMSTASKAAGYLNAAGAYAKGYTSDAMVKTMQGLAVAGGWASLAAADVQAKSVGYTNFAKVQAQGYTSKAQVTLYNTAAKAANLTDLAYADFNSRILGFTSYAARIVNDSKNFTVAEINGISSTLQSTYKQGMTQAYNAYGYALMATDYLKNPANLLSLLQKECAKNAADTYSMLGGPMQTAARNMASLSTVPKVSTQKPVPTLQLLPLPQPAPPVPSNDDVLWASAIQDKVSDSPNSISYAAMVRGKLNPADTQKLERIDAQIKAMHDYQEIVDANEALEADYKAKLISYAPDTTGTSAQQALVRLVRSIGRGDPNLDNQVISDLNLVAQAAGVIDEKGKNLFSTKQGAQHIGIYITAGGTVGGAGGSGTVAFGIDTADVAGFGYSRSGMRRPYAIVVGGGVAVSTERDGQAGISSGIFWGSGSINESEGVSLSLGFSQQAPGMLYMEQGMNWTIPTEIARMIQDAKNKNIAGLATGIVDQAKNLFTSACSAPELSAGYGIGQYSDVLSGAANLQLGYQHVVKKGHFKVSF
jgi:hypothetical protein